MNSKRILSTLALTFIIFNASFTIVFAQESMVDSLYSVWQDNSQPDSIRATAYNYYIGYGFLYSQPDSAFVLAEELIAFSKKKNFRKGEANGLNLQGLSTQVKGDLDKALDYFNRSLKIAEEFGSKYQMSKPILNIGNTYNSLGNRTKALEYYNRALIIAEKIGDKRLFASILGNIGVIYNGQDNLSKALEYFNRSLIISEEIGDKQGIPNGLYAIASIYEKQGNYSKALEYHNRSIIIAEETGYKLMIAANLDGMGKISAVQSNTIKALEYYKRSLIIVEEIGDKNSISDNLKSIGNLYLIQGKTNKALDYCTQGLAMAEQIGALETQKGNCQCLYDTYKTMGNGNEALVYLEKINGINDSLNSEETNKQLQQMEFAKQALKDSIAQAETDRLVLEAHQEEMRKEEKTRNISFGVGAFLLLLAGGMYTRVRYIRKSRANLQVEKDRSENLLLNILPEEIARELKEKGKADARDFEMVSILFTDFKGFTEQSAKLSAADLVNEINHCFEAFDGIMEKYGIEKIKTIGDAYMAAGGLPVPTDDSVKNTVLAALEMQDFIIRRKAEKNAKEEPAFEMRVGIHTGPVVAGIVGVKKFQYDIWGDTVNTASRIESNGEVGKVNISQATYELLKNTANGGTGDANFAFESRGKIAAKGKGDILMYFVSLKRE